MGEVVSRSGAGNLVKIIVQERIDQGVKCVCACLCMFSLSRRCVQVLISVRMCCS
jgi:hypothetical protein